MPFEFASSMNTETSDDTFTPSNLPSPDEAFGNGDDEVPF